MNAQLPLEIQLQNDFTLENYCADKNQHLLNVLKQFINNELDTKLLYIWGVKGSGKSHLLQACCHALKNNLGIYLPLLSIQDLGPVIFENMASYALICIDDIESIGGKPDLEESCFHLYNQVLANADSKLIISACCSPNNLPILLPDLKSRLTSGLIFQVEELSDEHKMLILQQYCEKKGFYLSLHIAQFLLTHCSRNLHHLLEKIEILDKASLAAKKRITLAFVKKTLKLECNS